MDSEGLFYPCHTAMLKPLIVVVLQFSIHGYVEDLKRDQPTIRRILHIGKTQMTVDKFWSCYVLQVIAKLKHLLPK